MPALTVFQGTALCPTHLHRAMEAAGLLPGSVVLPTVPGQHTAAVPGVAVTTPARSAAPDSGASTPPPVDGHVRCTDCSQWTEPHYSDVAHCGCGAPLIGNECETVLEQTGRLQEVIAGLAPGGA